MSSATDLQMRREKIVLDHFADETRQDFDAVLGTFPHPHYELIPSGEVHDGDAQVRRYYAETRKAFPDQRHEIIQLRHAADSVIVEFWLLGTHRGPLHQLPATGNAFRTRMIALFIFDGETLVCERVYFDSLTMLRQLLVGVSPAALPAIVGSLLAAPAPGAKAGADPGAVAAAASTAPSPSAQPSAITPQDQLLTLNIHQQPALPTEDPKVTITPLFLDRNNGVWVLYGRFAPGTVLPTHFHTGTVHFFTTRGHWHYLEHAQDPQTAGSYLFEPAGSIHTFAVPEDATEPAEGFMVVSGANVNFVDDQYHSMLDAGSIEAAILAAVQAGMMPMPHYLKPQPVTRTGA